MVIKKVIDGHLYPAHYCDRCNDLIEDRAMYLDGQEICPKCFGKWWAGITFPAKKKPAAATRLANE